MKGARSRKFFGRVEWLLDAGVISICHCLNFPELPLTGNYDESKYKLHVADTGLLIAMLDEEAGEDLRKNRILGFTKGSCMKTLWRKRSQSRAMISIITIGKMVRWKRTSLSGQPMNCYRLRSSPKMRCQNRCAT